MFDIIKQTKVNFWSVKVIDGRAVLFVEADVNSILSHDPSGPTRFIDGRYEGRIAAIIGAADMDFSAHGFARDGQIWKRDAEYALRQLGRYATLNDKDAVLALFSVVENLYFPQWYTVIDSHWETLPSFFDWALWELRAYVSEKEVDEIKAGLKQGLGMDAVNRVRELIEAWQSADRD